MKITQGKAADFGRDKAAIHASLKQQFTQSLVGARLCEELAETPSYSSV